MTSLSENFAIIETGPGYYQLYKLFKKTDTQLIYKAIDQTVIYTSYEAAKKAMRNAK